MVDKSIYLYEIPQDVKNINVMGNKIQNNTKRIKKKISRSTTQFQTHRMYEQNTRTFYNNYP